MRNYLILVILMLSTLNLFSQTGNDSSHIKPEEPKIIANKQFGGPNRYDVKIRGTVFDSGNKGIYSGIYFKNITTGNQIYDHTDDNGNFEFYAPPGKCIVIFQNSNYKKLVTDTFTLASVQELEIIISLGSKIRDNGDTKGKNDTTSLANPPKN
jgi:hypothetical protein